MSSKIAILRPSGDELSPPPKVLELLNKAYIDLSKIKLERTNMTTNNNTTTLIIKERGEGKTTQLLYTSATTQYPIIVQNKLQIRFLVDKASELKLNIPTPMTVEEFKGTRDMSENHVPIDEGYDLIGEALSAYLGAPVVAVTLTDKIKERNN